MFPLNYSILYSLALVFLMASFISYCMVQEKDAPVVSQHRERMSDLVKQVLAMLRADVEYRRLVIINILIRCMFMAQPFYVVFGQKNLGFAPEIAGLFVSAQMLGLVLASNLWGYISDNFSNKLVIFLTGLITTLTPVLALSSYALHAFGISSIPIYLMLYATLGFSISGIWIGFNNYILEITGDHNRALYLGFFNTVTAPVTFFPVVGGIIAEHLSYSAVFVLTAALVSSGLALTVKIKDPRNPGGERSFKGFWVRRRLSVF